MCPACRCAPNKASARPHVIGLLVHTRTVCCWIAVQALQLVVVAVHAKALSLLYVDQLLEDVKQVSCF